MPDNGKTEPCGIDRRRPKGRCLMNKAELICSMTDRVEKDGKETLTAEQMKAALDALIGTVTDTLKSGDNVLLPGFGMFCVKTRATRQGRNPFTGESITIPERKMPAFKAGKTLKDAVAAK